MTRQAPTFRRTVRRLCRWPLSGSAEAAGGPGGSGCPLGWPWGTVALAKGLLLAAVAVAMCLRFNSAQFKSVFARWPSTGTPTLASRLGTWDTAHYLALSEVGYVPGSHSCAFYPLWPAVIHAATPLALGSPLIAGLALANALSLAAFWLLYRLMERRCGEAVGRDALILLLAFPGALFFSFPYTESLYLLMILAFLAGLERERYFWPCLMAFLAPLAKAIGVFLVLPLAWHLLARHKPRRYWLLLLAPLLGYAAYFGLIYAWTGNPFEGYAAQKAYPYSPSIANMFNWHAFSRAFLHIQSVDGMVDSALDRGFFVLFLALLPLVYRVDKTWFFYTLPTGLVPALTSYFMSYRRYIMVCFPVFIVLAQLLAKTKSRWLFWHYVVILAALQAWAIKQFTTFNWAG